MSQDTIYPHLRNHLIKINSLSNQEEWIKECYSLSFLEIVNIILETHSLILETVRQIESYLEKGVRPVFNLNNTKDSIYEQNLIKDLVSDE